MHTIGLRACGLSREQVLAIQANTVPQTNQAQKFPGHEEEHPSAELGWGGTGSGGDGGDGGGAANDVLPWREEKRLGFRAACLRDWLLDAARCVAPTLRKRTAPVARVGVISECSVP